ncbi:hypothetical protein [Haloarcula argentinensis]|uniref:Uncharacterized protein n=1 Tax=Haloarcula argentinensis TaxID=43776 RepID=A0A847U7W6_HALAR|nr:hypothetical protein [Haloarcula argentinensis]NLV14372.1 hypothetical protein [Haloarcula argentinensis]
MGNTRRELITGGAVAAGLISAAQQVRAAFSEQPDHVTIDGYDDAKADIETYQPLLDLSNLEVRPNRQYAWRARSEEYGADWYCYWTFYTDQQGIDEADSHLPDREPVYVAVSDGAVDRVVYSTWHYAAETDDDPSQYDSTHPRLQVIAPWHGHQPSESGGEFVTLDDLSGVYGDWLANGWGVDRRSVVDPPHAEDRGNWWPESQQRDHKLAVWFHELTGGWVPDTFRLDT